VVGRVAAIVSPLFIHQSGEVVEELQRRARRSLLFVGP
jgi:CO dehydrogenase/acetyl-CoA synthase epsilon subunit